jgi:hypothetical protein
VSWDEKSLPLFQGISRGYPLGGDDVCSLPIFVTAGCELMMLGTAYFARYVPRRL